MATPTTIVSQIEGILPQWMVGAYRETMAPLLMSFAVTLDALKALVDQGRMGWLPGQQDIPGDDAFDNFDALPLILRDRNLRAGLLESQYSQADRARRWLEEWARSATPYELLRQLAAILSPNPPRLFLVTAGGTWWIYDAGIVTQYTQGGSGLQYATDGTLSAVSSVPHAWDWDSLSEPDPLDKNDPSRFWIGFDCPCNGPYLAATDGTFDDLGVVDDYYNAPTISGAGPSPDAGTIGTVSPRKHVELIRGLVYEWRAAGLVCAYAIVNFTTGAFHPLTDSTPTSIPDGKWGWHSKYDAGTQSRVVARFVGAEYWPGVPGGINTTPNP